MSRLGLVSWLCDLHECLSCFYPELYSLLFITLNILSFDLSVGFEDHGWVFRESTGTARVVVPDFVGAYVSVYSCCKSSAMQFYQCVSCFSVYLYPSPTSYMFSVFQYSPG